MMQDMRTTVTLDADTDQIVRRLMRDRGMTFKQAVNEAIRAGRPSSRRRRAFRSQTFDMGPTTIPLDKAMRLAADLEDEELLRKIAARK
jgi:type II secretory pathway component PulF